METVGPACVEVLSGGRGRGRMRVRSRYLEAWKDASASCMKYWNCASFAVCKRRGGGRDCGGAVRRRTRIRDPAGLHSVLGWLGV